MSTLLSPEIEATYDVLQELGAGGMGAVYKVRHRTFNELAVIKVMLAHLQQHAVLRRRFEREAKKGKELSHPHIARVLNYFIGANGNAHLVMEYIDGVNLWTATSFRNAPLPAENVIAIGVQVLSALSHLHANGLVHRDVSPDNMMVTKNARGEEIVKVIDLGIAKALDESQVLTQQGRFIGKYHYASPEQFSGDVDSRSDLYSLGVVLYRLATNAFPIDGASENEILLRHCTGRPRPFAETDPQGRVPEKLRRVILQALEKDPARRPQSADAFAKLLRASLPAGAKAVHLLDAATAVSPTASTVPNQRAVTPLRRDHRRTVSVVVVTAASLIALGGASVLVRREVPSSTQTTTVVPSGTELTVLPPALETQLASVIREVVADELTPAQAEPRIATLLQGHALAYDEVEPLVRQLTENIRRSSDALTRGQRFIATGNAGAAFDAFSEATRTDAGNPFAWANLGGAAALLERADEAMAAYQRAMSLDETNWLARYNYACQLARTHRSPEAIAEIEIAVRDLRAQRKPAEVESILASMRDDAALEALKDDPTLTQILAAH